MSKVIGIDLGTTNSCMAALEMGSPIVIPNAEGARTTPSVVAFTADGEILVGDAAKRQAVSNAKRTISSVKRIMGSTEEIRIDGNRYLPQNISAMILQKLKKDAEAYLGGEVTGAVITVPAYFNDAQRKATQDAGRIAGLDVLRIINEPTSAALAYGLDHGENRKILVYDLGGGTFDVSLIEIGDRVIEVLATAGDNHLGGDDFDQRLSDWVIDRYKEENRINLRKDPTAVRRITEACETAKRELSTAQQTTINLPFIATIHGQPIHLEMSVSRLDFEKITEDLLRMTEQPIRQVLSDAGVSASELNQVLLVGGSTRMPAVQELVRTVTGKDGSHSLNPDECVALGASVQAARLAGEIADGSEADLILMDVTPLSLSIETVGGIATRLIERNTPIPTRHKQVFSTAANFQTSVDIKVLQGERQFSRDNKLLGNFRLSGIRRAMAGVPQIEVTFDIDANGIVHVSAKDLQSGREKGITITSDSGMSEDEIRQAVRDAKTYSESDGSRKERFDAVSDARRIAQAGMVYLSAHKKEIDRQDARQLRREIAELEKMSRKFKPDRMTEEELQELRQKTDALNRKISGSL